MGKNLAKKLGQYVKNSRGGKRVQDKSLENVGRPRAEEVRRGGSRIPICTL